MAQDVQRLYKYGYDKQRPLTVEGNHPLHVPWWYMKKGKYTNFNVFVTYYSSGLFPDEQSFPYQFSTLHIPYSLIENVSNKIVSYCIITST